MKQKYLRKSRDEMRIIKMNMASKVKNLFYKFKIAAHS